MDGIDDTDTDILGQHAIATCTGTCDVLLNSTQASAVDCLSEADRLQWVAEGWNFTGGPHRLVLDNSACEEPICFGSCDEVGENPVLEPACLELCTDAITSAIPGVQENDPGYWEARFQAERLPGCSIADLGFELEFDCSPIIPTDCVDHPNFNPECYSEARAGADFEFVVDPVVSTTVIEITNVGTASVPMAGHLFVSAAPSEFLAGSVDGPAVSLAGVAYAATHAWFDVPIDVSTSGTSFTVSPAEASKTWAAGFDSTAGLFEFYDLQPTETTTGSINPAAGTWSLSYMVVKPFGSIAVSMGGAIVAL